MNEAFKLEEILPIGSGMILLSSVTNCDLSERTCSAVVSVKEEDLFFDRELGGVPIYLGLEYMAQTVASLSGIGDKVSGKTPSIGFMLGTRRYDTFIEKFLAHQKYTINAKELFFDGGMAVFACEILDENMAICATAEINVYRPNQGGVFNYV